MLHSPDCRIRHTALLSTAASAVLFPSRLTVFVIETSIWPKQADTIQSLLVYFGGLRQLADPKAVDIRLHARTDREYGCLERKVGTCDYADRELVRTQG
jgi:hypothetical protein